jgi:hypothetical protein
MATAALLGALAAVAPHAHLDRAAALSLVPRWRPQVVNGEIASLGGVTRYAFARIHLEGAAGSAVLGAELDLYLATVEPGATRLHDVLWTARDADVRLGRFRALRAWHARHFPDAALVGDGLRDADDLALWFASAA